MKRGRMNIDRAVMALAGSLVLLGLLLAWLLQSPWWLLLPALVGANLLQAGFTGFCPAARLFARFGLPPGQAFG